MISIAALVCEGHAASLAGALLSALQYEQSQTVQQNLLLPIANWVSPSPRFLGHC